MESSELPPGVSCLIVELKRRSLCRASLFFVQRFIDGEVIIHALSQLELKDLQHIAQKREVLQIFGNGRILRLSLLKNLVHLSLMLYCVMESSTFFRVQLRSSSKVTFRSLMIAEILSEARSHLVSEPTPYLFIGSKVHCKKNSEKAVEFMVKSGYVLMHIVDGMFLFAFLTRKPHQTHSNSSYHRHCPNERFWRDSVRSLW